jgi:hypothetical protein
MDAEIDMMFPQLKAMFPNMDDEIILQIILQNSGDYNKMVDIMISFQVYEIKEESKENKELSLFSNTNPQIHVNKPQPKLKEQKKEILSQNQLAFEDDDKNVKVEAKPNKKSIGQKVSSINI